MYQIRISTDKKYAYWIEFLLDALGDGIREKGGVFAEHTDGNRRSVCFAAEQANKNEIRSCIRNAIIELFTALEKRMYFINALNIRFCDPISRDMLVNTLSSFNVSS